MQSKVPCEVNKLQEAPEFQKWPRNPSETAENPAEILFGPTLTASHLKPDLDGLFQVRLIHRKIVILV